MTNLLETNLMTAAKDVKLAQLKRLFQKAQELGRESDLRMKELRRENSTLAAAQRDLNARNTDLEIANVRVQQELDRIPGWVRSIFRAKD